MKVEVRKMVRQKRLVVFLFQMNGSVQKMGLQKRKKAEWRGKEIGPPKKRKWVSKKKRKKAEWWRKEIEPPKKKKITPKKT